MSKKKKEEKVLEVKIAERIESIVISFGNISAKLEIVDGLLVGISFSDTTTFMRNFFVWHNEIEDAVAIFKKIIAFNDALKVFSVASKESNHKKD